MPLIKVIGAANLQSPVKPVIARKYLPLRHRNTRLECVQTNAISKHRVLVVAKAHGYYFFITFFIYFFQLGTYLP